MNTTRYLANAAAGITLVLLAGCGGGGGGGGGGGVSAVVYSGNTNPAVITNTNAATITANTVGGTDSAVIVGGVSTQSSSAAEDQGTGPTRVAKLLGQDFHDIVVRTNMMRSTQRVLAAVPVPIDDTQPCDFGNGTIRIFGTIDSDTLTGTVTFVFTDCLLEGVTLNGTGTMRIDVFLTDFTMSFARLTLRGAGLSIDAGGSLRYQEMGTTVTITLNLDEINNNTGKMRKSANLVIVSVFNDLFNPTSFTQTLTGQVYHSDHGFVNVATNQVLFFGTLAQLFPDSGQIVLTGAPEGASNRTIRVTALTAPPAALPATLAMLELDLDGDGGVDNTATLKWTDLTGPVGSNLADDDGDLMHNSWETANGLNPGLDDAAGDKDGDTVTNLQEYLAGTNP